MYANENCHGKLRPRRAANEAFPKHGESKEKSQQTKKPAKKPTLQLLAEELPGCVLCLWIVARK